MDVVKENSLFATADYWGEDVSQPSGAQMESAFGTDVET